MHDWKTRSVAELAAPERSAIAIGPFGSRLTADNYVASGVPVVRGQNITNSKLLDERDVVYVSESTARSLESCIVRHGDLVFPHRGAIGRVGIVTNHVWLLSTSMMKVTLNQAVASPEFVFYYFRGPGKAALLEHASIVGTPGIAQPLTALKSIEIRLPPLDEQIAIAKVLGALDDKIAVNERLGCVATKLARELYVDRTLGEPRTVVADSLTPVLGGTPPRDDESMWNGGVSWASAKDIVAAPNGVVLSTNDTISELAASTSRTRPLPPGTVVVTARGTVGAVARLGVPAAINQSCYGFIPADVPSACLYFVVNSAAEQALSLVHGSVFDTITMRTFEHVYMPSLKKTDWLALEERISPLLSRAQQAVAESELVRHVRDELLPLLMSGRIRVRDAEKVVEEVA
jgi:type I restriction enzyme, S subunit